MVVRDLPDDSDGDHESMTTIRSGVDSCQRYRLDLNSVMMRTRATDSDDDELGEGVSLFCSNFV